MNKIVANISNLSPHSILFFMLYFCYCYYVKYTLKKVIAATHEHKVNQTLLILLLFFFILKSYFLENFFIEKFKQHSSSQFDDYYHS